MDRDVDPACIGELRSKQLTLQQIHSIQSRGSTRDKTVMKTRYGIKDKPNALLELPLDLHRYEIIQYNYRNCMFMHITCMDV